LRVSSDTATTFYYDGGAVERGNTKGLFTDIDMIQLNLENEVNPTYTASLWPVRMMFVKQGPSSTKDVFQFAVGSNWIRRDSAYDANNKRWYVSGGDLTLSNGMTILTGTDNTFLTLNDKTLTAQWRVRAGENFPSAEVAHDGIEDSYHLTLYVEDLINFQDQSGDLYLNNLWYFHRLGLLTLKETKGTIKGRVYDDNPGTTCDGSTGVNLSGWTIRAVGQATVTCSGDSNGSYSCDDLMAGLYTLRFYRPGGSSWIKTGQQGSCTRDTSSPFEISGQTVTAGLDTSAPHLFVNQLGTINGNVHDSCSCTDSINPPGGWNVTLFPGEGNKATGTNNYSFTNVPYGNYTIFLNPPAGWQVCDQSEGSCGCSDPASQNLSVTAAVSSALPFYCENQNAWWQTMGGSIHSGGEVASEIPYTVPINERYLMLDDPSRGEHGVLSYQTLGGDLSGKVAENPLEAVSAYQGDIYGYDWWVRHLREESKGTFAGGPIAGQSGLMTLTGTNISGNLGGGSLVLLKSGSLTVNGDIEVDNGGFLMVVASGTITINSDVDIVHGIFIADKIEFVDGSGEDTLEAQGTFVGWTSVNMARDIGGSASALNPSILFTFRPDFLIHAPDFVKRILYDWQQVPG
jgi:hypothetical protein